MLVLGIDIGGTFTDLILFDSTSGQMSAGKVPSVPGREWEGLEQGLTQLSLVASRLSAVVHGTTVATNALLEGKGVRTALVTTKGFRDLLDIGRCMRLTPGSLFQTHFKRPAPMVERDQRVEIDERVDAAGRVVRPLSAPAMEALADTLRKSKPQAVAICLLNSYANPEHEKKISRFLVRAGVAAPIYASHEISPEYREYERLSTTVINAAISPILDRYLDAFENVLRARDFTGALYIMASNGGTIPRRVAGRSGAQTILSGPVGGIRGAMLVAGTIGRRKIITLDMGGTSTDVALIDGAEPMMANMSVINGYPLRLPQLNIVTVGAGGGSLARVDEAGGVDVGPESAGARPGPACYGLGGTGATVTDANLVIGRLGESLLGGAMRLHSKRATQAMQETAKRARMSTRHLAEGIIAIAVARMANAIREVSVQQGVDPRDFSLFAFGGAGPLHACAVAEELGIKEVVVPPYPGHVCAYGLLGSELRRDSVRTWLRPLSDLKPEILLAEFRKDAEAMRQIVGESGWPLDKTVLSYGLDLRYIGQAFEVLVKLRDLSKPAVEALPGDFGNRHEELYGHRHDRAIEVVNLRMTARAPPVIQLDLSCGQVGKEEALPKQRRRLYENGRWLECAILQRQHLARRHVLSGPAIIEETGSTTYLPSGWSLRVQDNLALVLTASARGGRSTPGKRYES